jgi:NAD(P)-dependent dehydrogenase (short-subunit alcohol dehydrogenase family)
VARVVNVSSDSHYSAKGIDFDAVKQRTSFTGTREYAISKLCNVLFTQELARRLGDDAVVTTYALHPGVVASDIWRRVPALVRPLVTRRMLTTEEGARTSAYCATSAEVASQTGLFYDKCQLRPASQVATAELAGQLWRHSADWSGLG